MLTDLKSTCGDSNCLCPKNRDTVRRLNIKKTSAGWTIYAVGLSAYVIAMLSFHKSINEAINYTETYRKELRTRHSLYENLFQLGEVDCGE